MGSNNLIMRRDAGAKGQEQEGSHTAEQLLETASVVAAPRM